MSKNSLRIEDGDEAFNLMYGLFKSAEGHVKNRDYELAKVPLALIFSFAYDEKNCPDFHKGQEQFAKEQLKYLRERIRKK